MIRNRRWRRAALLGLAATTCLLPGTTRAAEPAERPLPAASPGPGVPPVGLDYFRIDPDAGESVYRLVVVQVRFPDEGDLGSPVEPRLNGEDPERLEGYFLAATAGTLRVESTLAPAVTADHPLEYYATSESGTLHYGLDPNAYPRNAPGLVAEVTAKLQNRVDFRLADNTGDGFADGLLILHAGPGFAETGSAPGEPALASHAFSLPVPRDRGDVLVFPYALASARDAVGPWAHETGHLLGLPDLYVRQNQFCPQETGLGEWSLMATGANRNGGFEPSGLDAFSRQRLGFEPEPHALRDPVALGEARFLRVFTAAGATGNEYFLVERRAHIPGLGPSTTGWVVYSVNEDAAENLQCEGTTTYRRVATVRAVVCPDDPGCNAVLDDDTTPDLRDRSGNPTGLVLTFTEGTVTVDFQSTTEVRVDDITLGAVAPLQEGNQAQTVGVWIRNPGTATVVVESYLLATIPAVYGATRISGPVVVPPGAVVEDTGIRIFAEPLGGTVDLPAVTEPFTLQVSDTTGATLFAAQVTLPVNQSGLPPGMQDFTTINRNPARTNPWELVGGAWQVTDLGSFADAELLSPWLSAPANARLALAHIWNFAGLTPDVSFDGAEILLRRPFGPDVTLGPDLGWGYTVETTVGNPLGGRDVLSGTGDRTHVLPLPVRPGSVGRIVLRVAGDFQDDRSLWFVDAVEVQPAPAVQFTLATSADGSRLLARAEGINSIPVQMFLHAGPAGSTPTGPPTALAWEGDPEVDLGPIDGAQRFDLVWTEGLNVGSDVAELTYTFPDGTRSLVVLPSPNPLLKGSIQRWTIALGDGAPTGTYRFDLIDVAGRRVRSYTRVLAELGERSVLWDGRTERGSIPASGVYFLRVTRPDGMQQTRRIVLIP